MHLPCNYFIRWLKLFFIWNLCMSPPHRPFLIALSFFTISKGSLKSNFPAEMEMICKRVSCIVMHTNESFNISLPFFSCQQPLLRGFHKIFYHTLPITWKYINVFPTGLLHYLPYSDVHEHPASQQKSLL